MSAPVDVLAVMDAMVLSAERLAAGEAVTSCGATVEVARRTRAAVAELLGALEPAISEEGMDQPELDRLRAALARAKGGAA
ncbi:hypothetical protein U2S91_04370 [Stenotrophomonas maltophilia]|uniref:hypothetical protein n=1 Tax=Stenotrophomonas maltophilia TaxID=40324 RepID=UPI0013DA1333|nr:hypothetical protein [Stenotrophomonas maltophilia]ELF4101208.1 hypothetical protein [Stenotrophomonas maltophilia]WQI21887.1 hypothetical protein U2S91_04370 [Stenotrophomonas maltophilia]